MDIFQGTGPGIELPVGKKPAICTSIHGSVVVVVVVVVEVVVVVVVVVVVSKKRNVFQWSFGYTVVLALEFFTINVWAQQLPGGLSPLPRHEKPIPQVRITVLLASSIVITLPGYMLFPSSK